MDMQDVYVLMMIQITQNFSVWTTTEMSMNCPLTPNMTNSSFCLTKPVSFGKDPVRNS